MDHMRISGTETSSVIPNQTMSFEGWKRMVQKCLNKLKPEGWCDKPTKLQFQSISIRKFLMLSKATNQPKSTKYSTVVNPRPVRWAFVAVSLCIQPNCLSDRWTNRKSVYIKYTRINSLFIFKASAHSFKHFTSRLLKLSFSLSIHLLPRMNVILDFIWTLPVQLRRTRNKRTLQNILSTAGFEPSTPHGLQITSPPL